MRSIKFKVISEVLDVVIYNLTTI